MSGEHDAFDHALRGRSVRIDVRAEQPSDLGFLHQLSDRCSPLACFLPAAILNQQSVAKETAHRAQHPNAMRRIVTVDGALAGRIAIDWSDGHMSHGVDIAVLPEFRSTGAGLLMLRAWLDVADCAERVCTLEVARANPVVRLYGRLGFDEDRGQDPDSPFVRMVRPARRFHGLANREAHRHGTGRK